MNEVTCSSNISKLFYLLRKDYTNNWSMQRKQCDEWREIIKEGPWTLNFTFKKLIPQAYVLLKDTLSYR